MTKNFVAYQLLIGGIDCSSNVIDYSLMLLIIPRLLIDYPLMTHILCYTSTTQRVLEQFSRLNNAEGRTVRVWFNDKLQRAT